MNYDPPEEKVPHNWPFPTYYGKPIVNREKAPEEPVQEDQTAPF